MPTVKQMLDMCRKFIGTAEGSNNWNIFAEELDKVGYFKPQKKQNHEFCSIFCDDMAYKLIKDVTECHKWLYQPLYNDLSASATYQMNYFKKAKRFYTMPQPGDWAFLRKDANTAKHVCIVESVGATTVTTIDANHGKKVCRVVRARSLFLGYGRPVYDDEKGGKVMIELDVLKRGSKGEQVKTIQRLLKSLGYKGADNKVLAIDGSFGANTEYAVGKFQKDNNIGVDKICGQKTWNALLK